MDIRKCFEILELRPNATLDEAREAYRDIVNVWHPDRFSNNPRLKHKAEEKLKLANLAYETVKDYMAFKEGRERDRGRGKARETTSGGEADSGNEARRHGSRGGTNSVSKTEAAVETGTYVLLSVCSHLYKGLRRFVKT
jgi:DnaJ-class molecular chaperone